MEDVSVIRTFSPSVSGAVKVPTVSATAIKVKGSGSRSAASEGAAGHITADGGSQRNVSASDVTQAVSTLNQNLKLANHSLRFQIDDTTKDLKVLVVDDETGKVVRTIPPEASVRLAANGQPSGLFTVQG